MPLIPIDEEPVTYSPRSAAVMEPEFNPQTVAPVAQTLGDQTEPASTIGAAFRQSNIVASFIASRDASTAERYLIEDDFDAFEEIKGTRYEGQEDQFTDIFNRRAFEARKAQLDMEAEDRRALDAAGVWGDVASLGAAIASPEVLLPGGTLVRGVRGTYSIGKSALSLGVSSAAAASISEAALHKTQRLRTGTESAFAIGGSAVLGALLGGGVGMYMASAERRALAKTLEDTIYSKAPDPQAENEKAVGSILAGEAPGDAGAAAVRMATLDENTVAGRAAAKITEWSANAKLNPLVRLIESPSSVVRSIATGLVENPMYLKKNLEGTASEAAVETLVKETNGQVAVALQGMNDLYKAHRKAKGALTNAEFRKAVGMAMRRGDGEALDKGQAGYPAEVVQAAKLWREKVFEPLKERAIKAGLLPADVDVRTAESYFSRLWNWRKIEANEFEFKDIVRNWVRGTVEAEVERLTKNKEAKQARIAREIADIQLSGEERAKLLEQLPKELKALRERNPQFTALDERLGELRSQEIEARRGGDRRASQGLRDQINAIVENAGSTYADYVAQRNLLSTRLRRIRNNLVGREDQIEQLRARMADAESTNIDRLWRMHRSLVALEKKAERESPEAVAAELTKARTQFAQVLERSQKAEERLAVVRQKKAAEAERAQAEGKVDRALEIEKELERGDPFVAEAKRQKQLDELSERIAALEDVDPEDAIAELRMLVERRINLASELVENTARRMVRMAQRMEKSDPKHLQARVKQLEARSAEVERDYLDRVDIGLDRQNDYESYVDEVVTSIYNQLTGRGDVSGPRDIVPIARGPLKERTFNIPDRLVEDFLESDVELVGRRYARIMAAEVEMARKFGSPDMKEVLLGVERHYTQLREAVASAEGLDSKARANQLKTLNTREKADKRDIEALRDMLRGTYLAKENASNFARVLNVANIFNYLRMMGGVVASSMADVARPMMVHGLGRYFNAGIRPLVTNLKGIKLTARESRAAGIAETILHSRLATMAEIADPYSMSSPFERFMENLANGFSRFTLLPYWNDFQKLFTSAMVQDRVLEGVATFGKLDKTEQAYLNFLGIDGEKAERIAAQFKAHGYREKSVRVANTEAWDDDIARTAFRAAINKDVDSTIVTKGAADGPLFQHTPVGRSLLQFKSFALASHQRAFIRGLQAAELGVDGGRAGQLAGVMSATTIGMFIYWLKSMESNRQKDISDNPGRWIAEGLDRSGLFAVAFEINNTTEKAFGIGAYRALQAAFPGSKEGKASRYMMRSVAAGFTGPTGDFVDTLVRVANGVGKGDLSEGDVNAIRRLAPFATLPILRSIVEYGVMPAAREAVAN